MSLEQPASKALENQVVDLTFREDHEDSGEEDEGAVVPNAAPAAGKKKDKRKGRRSGKGKSGKGKEKDQKQELTALDILNQVFTGSSDASTIATLQVCDNETKGAPDQQALDNVYVPVFPHYVLRPVSSSNDTIILEHSTMPQSGLFATQDIPLGTRIICEPPLITLPAPGDQIDGLLLAFAALSEVDKERFWALPTCPASASEQLMAIKRQIDPLFPRMATLANKKTPQTPREVADVAKYGPRLEHAITTLRVAARWYAGRYSLTNLLEEERILLPKDTPIAGIFIEAGRLRHSCVPNCYAHYNSTANRMTVHATTNIAANEELNISHLASGYYEPAAERAQELSQKFGIRCNCTACSPSSNEYKKQEDARIRARDHALRLEHFLATLDDAEECDNSGAVVSLKPPTVSKPRTLAALEAAEQTALDVLQALRDMHCGSGIEFTRWFNALIDVINPALAEFPEYERATRSSLVLIHAAYVLRLCRWTVGEDSDEFAVLVARKKRVEGVIEGDEERAKGLEESRKRIGIL